MEKKPSYELIQDGMPEMHRILEVQTPVQDVTCGDSVLKLRIQTCPTEPSLLQIQTFSTASPSITVGAAQVNCRPDRVFRIGNDPVNSGQAFLSLEVTKNKNIFD